MGGSGHVRKMSSHYDLQGLRTGNRVRTDIGATLDLIMSRLNALESYAGQPLSSWYKTDPVTGTFYGSPQIAAWPHLRIDYSGAPYRVYVRDRVDQLRQIIGAPVFPWMYTPGKSDFDDEPHSRCGVDARGWLEMLQAIGRAYQSGQSDAHYLPTTTTITNGVTKVEQGRIDTIARASYYLDYHAEANIGQHVKLNADWVYWNSPQLHTYTSGSYDITISHYGSPGVKTGIKQTKIEIIKSCKRVSGAGLILLNSAEKDWVEVAGGPLVMVIGGGEGTIEAPKLLSGNYTYNGDWMYGQTGHCYGTDFLYDVSDCAYFNIHPDPNGSKKQTYGSGDRSHGVSVSFTPEFVISEDGSVSPVIPNLSYLIGSSSDDGDKLDSMITAAQQDIDNYRQSHANMDHIIESFIDPIPKDFNNPRCSGEAILDTSGSISIKRSIRTQYERQPDMDGGWLLWTAPYIPENYTERLAI